MAKKNPKSKIVPPGLKTKNSPSRNMNRLQQIHVDLFRTSVSDYLRNMGWTKDPVPSDFVGVAHQHFFRTFDSDGIMQKTTTPIAGHFHNVTVVTDDKGQPVLDAGGRLQVTIGPALQMTRVGKGKNARILPQRMKLYKKVVVNETEGTSQEIDVLDDHTHTAEYLRSDTVGSRELSGEAQELISLLSAKAATPPLPQGVADTAVARPDASTR